MLAHRPQEEFSLEWPESSSLLCVAFGSLRPLFVFLGGALGIFGGLL
jgi:hypothetical protein